SFRLIVNELDQQLDKSLAAIRHARGRAAHHPPDGAEADDAQNDGGGESIDVQHPEPALAHRLGEKRQVMLDVFAGAVVSSSGHLDRAELSIRGQKTPWRISAS